MSEYLENFNPDNLANVVRDLQRRVDYLERKEVAFNSLEEITNDLGDQRAGRFLALSSGIEPTDSDANGAFVSALGEEFGAWLIKMGVVKDGQLQFGWGDLAAIFAGGMGVIDASGINLNGIRYALRHYAEDPDGNNPRYGRFEMLYPENETIPQLSISYLSGEATTNLMTNGDFETGDLTGWVVDYGTWSVVNNLGNYAASISDLGRLRSNQIACNPTNNYKFEVSGVVGLTSSPSDYLSVYASWYTSVGGAYIGSTIFGSFKSEEPVSIDRTVKGPSNANAVCIYIKVSNFGFTTPSKIFSCSISESFLNSQLLIGKFPIWHDLNKNEKILSAKMELPSPGQFKTITAALVTTSTGNLANGNYRYYVTFLDGEGETLSSWESNNVTVDNTHKQVSLTIPVGGSNVTKRNIYRTNYMASGKYLLTQITNNTTTTFIDNISDANLGASAPLVNTTKTLPTLPTRALVRWKVDAFSKHRTGDTWSGSSAIAIGSPYGFTNYGSSAATAENGDIFEFDVYLAPGTYKMYLHGLSGPGFGKLDFYENDYSTPFASGIDFYTSTTVGAESINTVVLYDAGLHHITVKVNGKNASSSDYAVYIADIEFVRQ